MVCRWAWAAAREAALTREQQAFPLAKRIYDLRHACLSGWLSAGVPPTQVAKWAGHSVDVLLRIYAKCIDGQDATASAASPKPSARTLRLPSRPNRKRTKTRPTMTKASSHEYSQPEPGPCRWTATATAGTAHPTARAALSTASSRTRVPGIRDVGGDMRTFAAGPAGRFR